MCAVRAVIRSWDGGSDPASELHLIARPFLIIKVRTRIFVIVDQDRFASLHRVANVSFADPPNSAVFDSVWVLAPPDHVKLFPTQF